MRLVTLPLVVLLALVSWASGQITEGQWTYVIENGGATITGSTATGAVTIPSELGGYAVTRIGDGAFYASNGLTSVIIPNNVTIIGGNAFGNCTGLTSVSIGNGVTSIGAVAFQNCTGLTSVVIPDSVTNIGNGAFQSCTGLGSVVIPSRFHAQIGAIGFTGQLAEFLLVEALLRELALYVGPAPGGAIILFQLSQRPIQTTVSHAISLGIAQVQAAPNEYNLFSSTQYEANRIAGVAEGKAEVISNPTAYGLYTATSIVDLRMGGLMIQKQGTDATIVFQPQTTTDLATVPFTNNGPPITNAIPMPGDKGFLRVGAIYVPAGDLTDVLNDDDVVDRIASFGDSPPSGN